MHDAGGGVMIGLSASWSINNAFCSVYRHVDTSTLNLFYRLGSLDIKNNMRLDILRPTTNLAAVVCVCAKFDQFLAVGSYFESIRPENFVRIAKFPYAAFGPLFAFHCPLFFTRNNDL